MTDQDKKKIVELWLNGMSLSQISQLMPVKKKEFKETVAEMKRNGEFPTERKNTMQKIKEAYESGEQNPYTICETYGIKYTTLRDYKGRMKIRTGRPKHNYKKRKPSKRNPRVAEIKQELELGEKSMSEIARAFSVSRQYIYQLKQEMEI